MEKNNFEKYLEERYQNQIDWYSKESSKNKKWYTIFQWGVVIFSSIIPVLIIWLPDPWKWVTATLSVILAIGTASLKTFKYQENWINYRTISETLKKERHFYQAGLDEYADAHDKEALFVERVESLISRENSLWVTTHLQKADETKVSRMNDTNEPGKMPKQAGNAAETALSVELEAGDMADDAGNAAKKEGNVAEEVSNVVFEALNEAFELIFQPVLAGRIEG